MANGKLTEAISGKRPLRVHLSAETLKIIGCCFAVVFVVCVMVLFFVAESPSNSGGLRQWSSDVPWFRLRDWIPRSRKPEVFNLAWFGAIGSGIVSGLSLIVSWLQFRLDKKNTTTELGKQQDTNSTSQFNRSGSKRKPKRKSR